MSKGTRIPKELNTHRLAECRRGPQSTRHTRQVPRACPHATGKRRSSPPSFFPRLNRLIALPEPRRRAQRPSAAVSQTRRRDRPLIPPPLMRSRTQWEARTPTSALADHRRRLDLSTIHPRRSSLLSPPWLHPWIRVQIAFRTMLSTRWGDQWPTVKVELGKGVHLREVLRKAQWWN